MASNPSYTYIDNQTDWNACIDHLNQHEIIAIDLESNSLYVYKEDVCLIQITAGETDYIIDPQSDIDMELLGTIIKNPDIEKVFHASEYDLILLKKVYNWDVVNLFDTMWAARILGVEKIGLANVLNGVFGVKLDKKFQTANWGKRPLTEDMLAYAQNDTHYLLRLRDHFVTKLKEAGHWEEAVESFWLQTKVNLPDYSFNPDKFWDLNGVRDLLPQNKAICKALYAFREQEAEKFDQPLFKIFDNRRLVQLAADPPDTMEDLFKTRGMPGWYVRRRGTQVLRTIKRARKDPAPVRPRRDPKPAQDILDRYDAMLEWRKARARERGVDSDIILNKEGCWNIGKGNPQTQEELMEYGEIAGPYRLKKYGADILEVLSNVAY